MRPQKEWIIQTQALVLAALGIGIVIHWGQLGFAFYDKSFFIDIAYRLSHGQKMYVDIAGIPHGPLTHYIQALFFKIFGIDVFSCLLHAGIVNAIAAAIVFLYFTKKIPPPWPFVLGLVTIIWFYGQIAWPWPEKISFLGALVSFILFHNLSTQHEKAARTFFVIGCLTGVSVWDKHNIALLLLVTNSILCIFLAAKFKKYSWIIYFYLGVIIIGSTLLIYFLMNGWDVSWFEFIVRPGSYDRFSKINELKDNFISWIYLLQSGGVVWTLYMARKPDFETRWTIVLILCIFGLQLINGTLNSAAYYNDVPLVALILGWILYLIFKSDSFKNEAGLVNLSFMIKLGVMLITLLVFIVKGYIAGKDIYMWSFAVRNEQQAMLTLVNNRFFKGVYLQQPSGDKWIGLLTWLKQNTSQQDSLWIFPSGVFVYAALEKPSTAPIVTWESRLMLNQKIREHDEDLTVQWLNKEIPKWIVLQTEPIHNDPGHNPLRILSDVPKIKELIHSKYRVNTELPGFQIYQIE